MKNAFAFLALGFVFTFAGHVHADAPPGRYVATADTVIDTRTGLIWQRASGPQLDFQAANNYCANLALGGTWRLPSIKELVTLVDYGRAFPAIDSTAFPGTPTLATWSSTRRAGTPTQFALMIGFGNGATSYSPVTSAHWVRCVR